MANEPNQAQATPATAQPAPAQAAPAQQQPRRDPAAAAPRLEPQRLQIEVVHTHQQPPPPPPAPTQRLASSPPPSDNSFLKGLGALAAFVIAVVIVLVVWSWLFGGGGNKLADINSREVGTADVRGVGPGPREDRDPDLRRAAPEGKLPHGVYRDSNGQLRTARTAPDNSPNGRWEGSRISCRGRAKGEQFRCEKPNGVKGWCTC